MTGFLSIFLRSHGGLPAGAPLLRGRSLSLHRTQPIRLVAHFRAHRLHDRRLAFTRPSVIGERRAPIHAIMMEMRWESLPLPLPLVEFRLHPAIWTSYAGLKKLHHRGSIAP